MEDSYEKMKKEIHGMGSLQNIRHPDYNPWRKLALPRLDARVFYVRISNFVIDSYTPESLTLSLTTLSHDNILEVNATQHKIGLDQVSCHLRRNRVDTKSEEVTFVSTDNIRFTGNIKFEVCDKDDVLLSGVLEMSNKNGVANESINHSVAKWSMSCESTITASTRFLKGKQNLDSKQISSPTIEVYVAGSFSGTPIILTKTLQISLRKKQSKKGNLGSIPECEGTECPNDAATDDDLPVAEYVNYKNRNGIEYNSYWGQTEYLEGEDGELSWFNAGVRVGVGIGLGVCLGVGIGVGLLVRTYQSTTRNFRRRLL